MHYIIFSLIGVMPGLLMALFGIGGGAFIVPALDAAFLAVPNSTHPPFQLIVIGSLCTIVIGSLPRAVKVLTGNKTERSVANLLILSALPFIFLASVVATQLADKVLRLGFAGTIVLIGLWTLFGKNPANQSGNTPLKPNTYKLISVGAISGISSALFGLGGATLLMPLLTMWVGLPIAICVDISILFVSVTSIVSLSTLSFAWVGIHGADSIDHTMLVLILILGVSAALTQAVAAGRLIKMKDGVRQRLLGCYLISLGGWVILRSFS
jgi:uncharacterized membrane protein YfcA